MKYKFVLWGVFVLYGSFSLAAQEQKYEEEHRLSSTAVPTLALEFVGQFTARKKTRWLEEKRKNGSSIEAKFRYRRQKYSVEFDTLGNLEDVEIQILFKSLENTLQEQIKSSLAKIFRCHKIQKIQIQYRTNEDGIVGRFDNDEMLWEVEENYELVVRGKEQNYLKLYEVTFSKTGTLLKRVEIISKNSDNLEY
jgi:hypothetical protein